MEKLNSNPQELMIGNKQTMSSREISEYTGKQHAHIMEAIRTMEPAWEKIGQSKFRLTYYIDQWNRQQPQYSLSKVECLYIATKFNDEARAKLILRWEELEGRNQLDFSNPDTVLMLAQNWADECNKRKLAEQARIEAVQINGQLQKKLEIAQPKADFAERVLLSDHLTSMDNVAKMLQLPFGRNTLFQRLREDGILMRNNVPYQNFIDMGLFEVKQVEITRDSHVAFVKPVTRATQKGMQYIAKMYKAKSSAVSVTKALDCLNENRKIRSALYE